tara:strand:+ start:52 stop:750 length:699 start_codon:yes stop_codon:yes gene_type:complete
MEDFYGDGSLNQFSSDRTRVQQTTGGIGKNNRRVRLLNFERAMKAQFGPNVVVSPDGTASRNGKVVGQIDTFLKGGGQLQGTPKDPRSELQIRKDENKRLRENYVAPTFEETMEGLFPKAKDRIDYKTFERSTNEVNLDEMSKYTDTGEVDTDFSPDMFNTSTGSSSAGTNATSTRDQLKMGRIERENRARFGDERVDFLKQKQRDFKSMNRKEFAKKYPKSQTAKALRIKK